MPSDENGGAHVTGQSRNERRKSRRLSLAVPVHFSSRSPAGTTFDGQGVTVDISPSGVRFETDLPHAPAPPTEIAVSITIPCQYTRRNDPVHISGRATVLRNEPVDTSSRHHTGACSSLAVRFHRRFEITLPILEDFAFGGSRARSR